MMTRTFVVAACLCALLVSVPPLEAATLSSSQLENLVAPVALYPDPLLDQVLDASQYPQVLVQAGDYVSDRQQGQQPDSSWPASVQALLEYPTVLTKLDDDLSWTTRLGNAVKTQRGDVEAAIQLCRQKAQQAGNLVSNDQDKVVVQNDVIQIVPTNPSTIYVPVYNPSMIYAPQPAGHPLITFGAGVAVGALLAHDNNWYYSYYHHHYYDHIYGAGGHVGYVGHYGAGSVTHVGGPYAGYTHAAHVSPWGATRATHVGGPLYGASAGTHVGPYGATHVEHVGGPGGGMTHVGHTGFYGHSSFNAGHVGSTLR